MTGKADSNELTLSLWLREKSVKHITFIRRVNTIAVATGKYCNNYKADAAELVHAAKALREHLSDARDTKL